MKKILLVAINAKYIHSNLAVYSLKAYADRYVHNIHIAEYTINNQVEDIIDSIYVKRPDMLAISCYIWNIEYVCKILEEIHKLLPNCKIWLGGPEVSYNTDYYLDKYDYIEGIIVGEGEETFKEVCMLYQTEPSWDKVKHELGNIAGIVTKDKRQMIAREAVDMSELPFPYTDLKRFENRIIYYESSRGCPYSCSYCLSCIDKKLRFRDIDMVENELRIFLEKRVAQVKFIDRTFNCDRERSARIWRFIADNDNCVTNFHFEVSSDLITDEHIEVLKAMRPGLVQLEIGVQSTNEDTLKAIRRKMNIYKLKNVVSSLRENKNIHIHLDLIAGLPYESMESFKKSFNDVYNMKPDELQLGFLKVLYGSYMYDDAKEYGIAYKSFPPYEVLYTNWLTYDDILNLKKVENVLEIYYGSGQFVHAVAYLERFFHSPYDFYDKLGKFYAKEHENGEKHSRIERYNILLKFAHQYNIVKNCNDIDVKVLSELMTLDIYLRENIKSRPAFSKDLEPYRNDIKAMARSLNISKSDHIEIFTASIMPYVRDVLEIEAHDMDTLIYVRFAYNERNPVNHNVIAKVICEK